MSYPSFLCLSSAVLSKNLLNFCSHIPLCITGDKTPLPLPKDQLITNNFEKFRRPITLPPSTLSDQMLLFASSETERPLVSPTGLGDLVMGIN